MFVGSLYQEKRGQKGVIVLFQDVVFLYIKKFNFFEKIVIEVKIVYRKLFSLIEQFDELLYGNIFV